MLRQKTWIWLVQQNKEDWSFPITCPDRSSRVVVPNYRAMGCLVPGRSERINELFYFRYIDVPTRKVFYFEKRILF